MSRKKVKTEYCYHAGQPAYHDSLRDRCTPHIDRLLRLGGLWYLCLHHAVSILHHTVGGRYWRGGQSGAIRPSGPQGSKGISTVYHAVRRFFYYVAAFFLVYSLVLGAFYYDIARVTIFSRLYVFGLVLAIGLTTLAKYMGGLANLTLLAADQKQYINNVITIGITLINTLAIVILTGNACDLIWVKLGSSLIFVVRPLLYAVYVKNTITSPRWERAKRFLHRNGRELASILHTFCTPTRMLSC